MSPEWTVEYRVNTLIKTKGEQSYEETYRINSASVGFK